MAQNTKLEENRMSSKRYFILLMAMLPSSLAICEDTLASTGSPIKDCGTLIQSFPCGGMAMGTVVNDVCQLTCGLCKCEDTLASTGSPIKDCGTLIQSFPCGGMAMGTAVDEVCQLTCGLCNTPSKETYVARVNLLQGEQGYYQFEGFPDEIYSPDIEVTIGETLVFNQSDHTNWFHPLGFSFLPDGPHGPNWDSAPPVGVEVGKLDSGEDDPAYDSKLRYYIAEVNECERLNRYDCYKDAFFTPKSDWVQSSYRVELDITQDLADMSHGGVIFYFCRIHSKMSGRIIIKNTDGTQATGKPGEKVPSLYTPDLMVGFDKECGTWGLGPYEPNVGELACDDMEFICGEVNTLFEMCIQAMDCAMHHQMRTMDYKLHQDPVATFMHQMIPHHMNAVNMGRLMLKTMDATTIQASGLEDTIYSVINSQMYQMHFFRKYLGTTGSTYASQRNTLDDHMHGPHCDAGKIVDIEALETWAEDKPFTLLDNGKTSACQVVTTQSSKSISKSEASTCDDVSNAAFLTALAQYGGSTNGITGCVDYLNNSDDRATSCKVLGTLCKKSCGLCPIDECVDNDDEFSASVFDNDGTFITCEEYITSRALQSSDICGRFSTLCPVTCNTCDSLIANKNAPVPDKCISTSIDLFQSDTGYYQFGEEPGQYQPDVHVNIGEILAFEQFDHSNWMYPIGFSFHPDNVAIVSEWAGAAPTQLSETYVKHYVDGSERDQDTYQRLFRQPRDSWRRSTFRTYVNVTQELADESYGGVIYYTNTMLRKMSGKLIIHNKDGSRATGWGGSQEQTLQPVNMPNAVDLTCGTDGLEDYMSPNGKYACSERFFCGTIETVYEKCLHALDCKMYLEMRTAGYDVHGDGLVTFSQQMIPHHVNAINMAKTLLSYYKDHPGPYGIVGDLMITSDRFDTLYEIMDGQTQQIQKMKHFLATHKGYLDQGFTADSVGPHCGVESVKIVDDSEEKTITDNSSANYVKAIKSTMVLLMTIQLAVLG